MPIAAYDRYFGGKGGAAKAMAALVKEYGPQKGRAVFYGLVNKRKRKQ
jgi:hypothetical protein